eukprot:6184296-Pleurochrysis_carterae.AAC.1
MQCTLFTAWHRLVCVHRALSGKASSKSVHSCRMYILAQLKRCEASCVCHTFNMAAIATKYIAHQSEEHIKSKN